MQHYTLHLARLYPLFRLNLLSSPPTSAILYLARLDLRFRRNSLSLASYPLASAKTSPQLSSTAMPCVPITRGATCFCLPHSLHYQLQLNTHQASQCLPSAMKETPAVPPLQAHFSHLPTLAITCASYQNDNMFSICYRPSTQNSTSNQRGVQIVRTQPRCQHVYQFPFQLPNPISKTSLETPILPQPATKFTPPHCPFSLAIMTSHLSFQLPAANLSFSMLSGNLAHPPLPLRDMPPSA